MKVVKAIEPCPNPAPQVAVEPIESAPPRVSIVRRLDSPTFLHKIEKKIKYMPTLFESVCNVCISILVREFERK